MSFDNSRLNERLLSPYGSDSAEDDLNVIGISCKFRNQSINQSIFHFQLPEGIVFSLNSELIEEPSSINFRWINTVAGPQDIRYLILL